MKIAKHLYYQDAINATDTDIVGTGYGGMSLMRSTLTGNNGYADDFLFETTILNTRRRSGFISII